MIGGILNRRKSHHSTAVIDRRAVGTRSPKRAQVRYPAVGVAEGVGGQIVPRVGLPGNLVPVIDCVGDAP